MFGFAQDSFDYYKIQIEFYGPLNFPKVVGKYPFTNGIDNRGQVSVRMLLHICTGILCCMQTMGTDNPFWCPTRYVAAGFANSSSFPVWLYNFDHAASFEFWPPNASYCDGHSCKE